MANQTFFHLDRNPPKNKKPAKLAGSRSDSLCSIYLGNPQGDPPRAVEGFRFRTITPSLMMGETRCTCLPSQAKKTYLGFGSLALAVCRERSGAGEIPRIRDLRTASPPVRIGKRLREIGPGEFEWDFPARPPSFVPSRTFLYLSSRVGPGLRRE